MSLEYKVSDAVRALSAETCLSHFLRFIHPFFAYILFFTKASILGPHLFLQCHHVQWFMLTELFIFKFDASMHQAEVTLCSCDVLHAPIFPTTQRPAAGFDCAQTRD